MLFSPRAEFSGPCADSVHSITNRVLPLFCQSSHHVYASEDVPTYKEITEEGVTNTQV